MTGRVDQFLAASVATVRAELVRVDGKAGTLALATGGLALLAVAVPGQLPYLPVLARVAVWTAASLLVAAIGLLLVAVRPHLASRRTGPLPGTFVAFAAAAVATGCTSTGGTSPTGDVSAVRAELAGLPVTSPVDPGRYDRVRDFGQPWADVDHDGCGTRDQVLRRDLVNVAPTTGCRVTSGTLHDPYTGRTIHWRRGPHSAAVQVDHVIPLHAAWQHGAASWPASRRLAYANDPQVLLAVDGPTNNSKGDKTAGEWRPPARAEWCDYATRYIHIATTYRLSISRADQVALARMIDTCTGDQS